MNSEPFGQRFGALVAGSDLADLLFGQLGHGLILTLAIARTGNIRHVLCLRSPAEVRRIDAQLLVTGVPSNVLAGGSWF